MITVIRRKAKSRLFRAVLLIIVFSMTIGGSIFVPGLLRQLTQATQALITIDGYSISPGHFAARAQHEYERIESFRQQFGEQADMFLQMLGLQDPQRMAYEALVREALINKTADKMGLPLDEGFIARQLQNPSFVLQELTDIVPMYALDRDGTINITVLNRYLHHVHLTMSDFERLVENTLRRSTVLGLLQVSAYVSTGEIRERFTHHYVPRNYKVLSFDIDHYLQKARQASISDEELQAFFMQENKARKRYWLPEARTGIVWEFAPDRFDIIVSSEDIEKYYTKHKNKKYVESPVQLILRRILLKVEHEAESKDVRKRLLQLKEELDADPSLFEKYAKEHSQDKKTALQGGLLPWYARQDLKPAIGTAAFRLSKDGDISDVVQTDEGYELIQRVERKAKMFKPLASVQDEIEKTLKKQHFSDQFTKTIKKKVSRKTPQESLAKLKKTYNAKEIVFKDVEFDATSRTKRELFQLKKNDTTHYIEDGTGFVIILQDINKAHAPAFEDVKDRVKEDWYHHKARTMLEEDLHKAETSDQSFEDIAKQFNVHIEHISGLSLDDKKQSEAWSKKGYPVAQFSEMQTVGAVKAFKQGSKGFLVKFVSEGVFDEGLFNKKHDDISRELYQETRERLQRGFVASLRRNATIKTSDTFKNIQSVK